MIIKVTLRLTMHAVFDHSEQLSKRTVTFWFKPEQTFRFEPGQYVELAVPHKAVDNRGITRWMSLTSTSRTEAWR
jgi:ferredoxin-NADP reductase